MPAWFELAPPDLVITPNETDTITCILIATDSDGASVNTSFTIKYATNNAPTVASPSGSMDIYDNVTFTHSIDMTAVFSDLDTNQTLVYSTTNVPTFLTKVLDSAGVVSFTGTPHENDVRTYYIELIVSDG